MPDPLPKIDEATPGHLTVYIESPADGSVGTCSVDAYRDLWQAKGWKLATPAAHAEHMEALADEHRAMQTDNPELLYPTDGVTAAQVATSRATKKEA